MLETFKTMSSYTIRPFDSEAKKSIIGRIIDQDVRKVYTVNCDVAAHDKEVVTEFRQEFKSLSDHGLGYYDIGINDANKFIDRAVQIKNNLLLERFSELF